VPSHTARAAQPASAWTDFYLFVDLWRLTYPKKAGRAAVMKAVKDFVKGSAMDTRTSEGLAGYHHDTHGCIRGLIQRDFTYMVSPANYFAAEKWTEKAFVKRDKNDVHCKTAGAHAIPNMPKITTIRFN